MAVHVLTVLAYKKGESVTSGLLAASVNTNPVVIRRLLLLLQEADFIETILAKANFTDCDLLGARFSKSDLRGANFADRRLRGTVFDHCRMHGIVGKPEIEGPCTIIAADLSAAGDGSDIRDKVDLFSV